MPKAGLIRSAVSIELRLVTYTDTYGHKAMAYTVIVQRRAVKYNKNYKSKAKTPMHCNNVSFIPFPHSALPSCGGVRMTYRHSSGSALP